MSVEVLLGLRTSDELIMICGNKFKHSSTDDDQRRMLDIDLV